MSDQAAVERFPADAVERFSADVAAVTPGERIALVDLLDRVLAGGVVVAGDITLSIADVDLVTVSLRALITSVSTLARYGADLEDPNQ